MLEDRNNVIIDSSQVENKIMFSVVRWVPVPAVRFSPGQGHYVVFLGKLFKTDSAQSSPNKCSKINY